MLWDWSGSMGKEGRGKRGGERGAGKERWGKRGGERGVEEYRCLITTQNRPSFIVGAVCMPSSLWCIFI